MNFDAYYRELKEKVFGQLNKAAEINSSIDIDAHYDTFQDFIDEIWDSAQGDVQLNHEGEYGLFYFTSDGGLQGLDFDGDDEEEVEIERGLIDEFADATNKWENKVFPKVNCYAATLAWEKYVTKHIGETAIEVENLPDVMQTGDFDYSEESTVNYTDEENTYLSGSIIFNEVI